MCASMFAAHRTQINEMLKDTSLIPDPVLAKEVHVVSTSSVLCGSQVLDIMPRDQPVFKVLLSCFRVCSETEFMAVLLTP